jgi:alkylhydroperoxidase family enzyme
MARIPYVDPENASETIRDLLAKLPADLNIFRMMAHAETNVRPMLVLGSSILAQQQLDDRLRELAILRVARLSHAAYEWVQHVPIAEAVGVSKAEIDAVDRGDIEDARFDELTQDVLRFTTEVVENVGAAPETFRRLAEKISHREIVELIIAVGFYMMMARIMESTEIDLDEPRGASVLAGARSVGGG